MLNHCWCLGFLTALIYPKNKKTVDGYSRYIVVAWIMKYNVRTHASKCAQFVVMTFSTPQLNPIDGRPEEITHHCGWFSGMVHESVWIESRTSVLRQYHEPSLSMQPLSISKPTFMQIGWFMIHMSIVFIWFMSNPWGSKRLLFQLSLSHVSGLSKGLLRDSPHIFHKANQGSMASLNVLGPIWRLSRLP